MTYLKGKHLIIDMANKAMLNLSGKKDEKEAIGKSLPQASQNSKDKSTPTLKDVLL
jgi:hypothetical protein